MSTKALFTPLQIGAHTLKNRLIMAPLTRCRAPLGTWIPNELMAEYYAQRASAGLIITEAICIAEGAITFATEGALYNDSQRDGWRQVVERVHEKGGLIFAQLAHGGRAAHPTNNNGRAGVAPSPIALTQPSSPNFNPTGQPQPYSLPPHELTDAEAQEIVELFRAAAKRAVLAGFDGVEIHGANGYLIDQFLCNTSNKRAGGLYSGRTIETRAQFLADILDAVVAEVGADRVGVRLSPASQYQDIVHEDPQGLARHVAGLAHARQLAYLHILRGNLMTGQIPLDVVSPARQVFKGPLLVNMGVTPQEAATAVEENQFDAPVFGKLFLANPDLPERIRTDSALNQPNPKLFYTRGPEGYTDYPFLSQNKL